MKLCCLILEILIYIKLLFQNFIARVFKTSGFLTEDISHNVKLFFKTTNFLFLSALDTYNCVLLLRKIYVHLFSHLKTRTRNFRHWRISLPLDFMLCNFFKVE